MKLEVSPQLKKISYLISNRVFKLILLPTEKCNFRCRYCYENYGLGHMQKGTIEAIKQLILARINDPDFSCLVISWFGGEPLIAKDIVLEISNYAKRLSQNNEKFQFMSGMTTNGYLLNEITFDALWQSSIERYQISLDGPKVFHDQTRVKADGSGSFDVIWRNLLMLKSKPQSFKVLLRLHVTRQNFTALLSFVETIKKTFGHDDRFCLFFKAVENLGGPHGGKFETFADLNQKQACIDQLHQLVGGVMEVKSRGNQDDYNEFTVCYASAPNALVIRSDGSIAKCTVDFEGDQNRLGHLCADGTLDISPEKFSYWIRGLKTMDDRVLYCPLKNHSIKRRGIL